MRATMVALMVSASCVLGVASRAAYAQAVPMRGDSQSAAAPGHAGAVTGKVLETMDAGGYTYLKIATPQGERWAAVPPSKVSVGDDVTIVAPMIMTDFEAKSLGRKFDAIIFGTLGGTPPRPPRGEAPRSPHGEAPRASMEQSSPLAKLESADGRTVAEIWAKRQELKDKSVGLRAKVVKLNRGIMGKNWLHVQDGSGTPEASNFDLAITTGDDAQVGDVVVVRGVVRVDKDFGAGYAYPVIVEDAEIEKN